MSLIGIFTENVEDGWTHASDIGSDAFSIDEAFFGSVIWLQ